MTQPHDRSNDTGGKGGNGGLPVDVVDAHLRRLTGLFDERDRTMGQAARLLLSSITTKCCTTGSAA